MAHKNFYLSVHERSLLVDLLSTLCYTFCSDPNTSCCGKFTEDEFTMLWDLRYRLLNNLDK